LRPAAPRSMKREKTRKEEKKEREMRISSGTLHREAEEKKSLAWISIPLTTKATKRRKKKVRSITSPSEGRKGNRPPFRREIENKGKGKK